MPAYGYSSGDLRFLSDTGVDPHSITTGRTPFGLRFATIGHYRVMWPIDGSHVRLVNIGTQADPMWREIGRDIPATDPRNDMGDFIENALLQACKR